MGDEDTAKRSHEEFERRSRQYASNKYEKDLDIWDLKPSKYSQGNYLAVKRYTRFIGYQLVKSFPRMNYDKVFTPAYQPFSIRNNTILFSATIALYVYYLIKCKQNYRKQYIG